MLKNIARLFPLLALAFAVAMPSAAADNYKIGHVYRQRFLADGSQYGSTVDAGTKAYAISDIASPVPGYTWSRTEVWTILLTCIGTYSELPYTVTPDPATVIFERQYFAANDITVNYSGNGSTDGSMDPSAFKFNSGAKLAKNAFVRSYEIDYDPNSGSVTPSSDTATFTFIGWKDSSGSYSYSDEQLVTNVCDSTGGEVTLLAQWNPGTVTLPEPTRLGYTFAGWYTAQSGGKFVGMAGAEYAPDRDRTLYARWTDLTYEATIAAGEGGVGGETLAYQPKLSSQALEITSLPTCVGHHLTDWSFTGYVGSKPSISGTVLTIPANTEGNFTATPTWTPNSYSIGYDNYSTHGKFHPTSGTFGTAFKVSRPENGEFKFDGWQVTQGLTASTAEFSTDGGSSWQPITSDEQQVGGGFDIVHFRNLTATRDGSVTLYANWVVPPPQYAITVVADPEVGGTVSGGGTYEEGTSATLSATPNTGYDFTGWTDGVSTASRSVVVSAAATYTAGFRAQTYTLVLIANGGTLPSGSETKSITYDQPYGDLPVPTPVNPGNVFDGWFTAAQGGTEITSADIVRTTGSIQLAYARWGLKDTFAVAFDGNDATNAVPMPVQRIFCGVETPLSSNVYGRVGYSFDHWTDGQRDYADGETVLDLAAADATNRLSVVWAPNQYSVGFAPNGAAGEMPPLDCLYDTPTVLPPCTFDCGVRRFLGWSMTPSGDIVFQDGDTVSNLTAVAGGTVTLHAQWDLGSLSEYVGLTNAVLTTEGDVLWKTNVVSGNRCLVCDIKQGQTTRKFSLLRMRVTGPGTVSFRYSSTRNVNYHRVWFWDGAVTNLLTQTTPSVTTPTFVSETFEIAAGEHTLEWGASAVTTRCLSYVDDVVWTPAAPEPPAPQPEDARDISAISLVNGRLRFEFANADERFDYQLCGTNELSAPPPWPVVWQTNAAGRVEIAIPVDPVRSQMFYYLRTAPRLR